MAMHFDKESKNQRSFAQQKVSTTMDLNVYISAGTCICLPQPSLQKKCGTFQLQNSQLYHLTFIWGICSQHLMIMMSNWIPKQHCDFFLNMPALHLRESWLNKESLKKGGNYVGKP